VSNGGGAAVAGVAQLVEDAARHGEQTRVWLEIDITGTVWRLTLVLTRGSLSTTLRCCAAGCTISGGSHPPTLPG
jgi:hypothetical protein